ncbi:concanavalin A-like lectin/glucanase domain-containing protein [Leucosporidium creatinivorum]|uniref:Concanavalin A-like lectin/glucanase domain-containing protein n=1 Tax=Leucosporidium creatinivorum TaxID=106004 RepID=A0A1Y2FY57_9BASI|nr:concanavalin A-like lectin/glucanase domain-containing protein [Leucosporidium creatinivorum]
MRRRSATDSPRAALSAYYNQYWANDPIKYRPLQPTNILQQAFPDGPSGYPGWPTPSPDPAPNPGHDTDETLELLLPLLILLTVLLFLLLVFLVFLLLLRRSRRGAIQLGDGGGPTNLEQEDELEGEGGLQGIEQRWLEGTEETTRAGYLRSKVWQSQYPPNSQPTDITLSQFLSIQEKGVSAWSFEPDYESNPGLIVQSRTEVIFLADSIGMAPEEGGGCCVQSNLPIPKLNDVYYWECKMFEKPESTTVAIGLTTKPYPSFRLPGWNKYSVGYFSTDGFKSHSYPFTSTSYGPPLTEGDVLGVGYRPRTGTVFFTRNGKKLEDAYIGLNRHNLFPTVGANAGCTLHVNFGQAGFVFIEANVKKWGLAPMMGTLAPPPAYGSERGSILLESAAAQAVPPLPRMVNPHGDEGRGSNRRGSSSRHQHRSRRRDPPPSSSSNFTPTATSAAGAASALATPTPNQPIRPSPLRHSRQASNLSGRSSTSTAGSGAGDHSGSEDDIQNPPTPGLLDISLQSLHRFPMPEDEDEDEDEERTGRGSGDSSERSESLSDEEEESSRLVASGSGSASRPALGRNGGSSSSAAQSGVSPPAYHPIDPHMYAPASPKPSSRMPSVKTLLPATSPLASPDPLLPLLTKLRILGSAAQEEEGSSAG